MADKKTVRRTRGDVVKDLPPSLAVAAALCGGRKAAASQKTTKK